jgi:hypothetical protein
MDYVMITAILTFFVLFFFLKNKEGYTDSYINGAIESLKKTSGNIEKTVLNIKDLTNTNNSGSSPLKIDVLEAIEQVGESLKNKEIDPEISTNIELQKQNLNAIQDNIIKINKKLKEVLDPVFVTVIRMNETKPVSVPLLTALNFVSTDITTINNYLQAIPDKKPDKK